MGNDIIRNCCSFSFPKEKNRKNSDVTRTDTFPRQNNEGPLNEIKLFQTNSNTSTSLMFHLNPKAIIPDLSVDYNSQYEITNIIGTGTYGKTYKVFNKGINKTQTMKILFKENSCKEYYIEEIENEIDSLSKIKHPYCNIIYEIYNDKENFYIISDYYPFGNLLQLMTKNKQIRQKLVKEIMKQIFEGLNYLHWKRIVHGNIKPENIYILNNENEINEKNIKIKLGDYGYWKLFNIENIENNSNNNDVYYLSPEMILNINNGYNIKTEQADIWACGIIMYYLLVNNVPFKGTRVQIEQQLMNINNKQINNILNQNISPQEKDLLLKCLTIEPKERITAREALKHSFIIENK